MLVVLLGLSVLFMVEPVVEDYPDDARVFPQLTAAVVFIGSVLLLLRNYLPEPLHMFVAESVSIASTDTSEIAEGEAEFEEPEPADENEEYTKETLGSQYGYEVNETAFMVVTAILYFVGGWAAGFLFVTPIYILGYTLWFRVNPVISVVLAVLGTVIIYLFMTYLVLPFDQGHIFDFSPFLPLLLDGVSAPIIGGGP
ncbi:hypothetical protein [Halopiger aswanensis]|uniref:Tripartite tricarboxylate transporter TctB family protein n=1 Tax=Halopiger aswanensis TaxID=148449 RepID=A0A3R7GF37_9EURY|nr:hypothetical protein [Halopiger aswanensis]RKD88027.1 hypothetical protein ATJ93_4518 [Halopiger aswanensis]